MVLPVATVMSWNKNVERLFYRCRTKASVMFFVLTKLQDEDNSPASVAELLQLSAPLTFHLSNGIRTQLGDLSLFGVLRDNGQLEDEIARSPSDLQSGRRPFSKCPPTKQPCLSVGNLISSSSDHPEQIQQQKSPECHMHYLTRYSRGSKVQQREETKEARTD